MEPEVCRKNGARKNGARVTPYTTNNRSHVAGQRSSTATGLVVGACIWYTELTCIPDPGRKRRH